MNNYEKMMEAARRRFTGYDMDVLSKRAGVTDLGDRLKTCFLNREVLVCKKTGEMTVNGRPANFGQLLSVLDWLCDRRNDAVAEGDYCPVSDLSRVYVSGSNLNMEGDALADRIHRDPDLFRTACEKLGGKSVAMGDMGYCIPVFPDLFMCVKFYFADDEFPAVIHYLWDKNMLSFVRYETIYYIAGCLRSYLMEGMSSN